MPAPIPAPIAVAASSGGANRPTTSPATPPSLGAVADGLVAVLLHLDLAARVAIHHDGADDLVLAGVLAGLQRREVVGGCSRIGVRADHEHEIVTCHCPLLLLLLSAVTTCPAASFVDTRAVSGPPWDTSRAGRPIPDREGRQRPPWLGPSRRFPARAMCRRAHAYGGAERGSRSCAKWSSRSASFTQRARRPSSPGARAIRRT